MIGIPFTAPFDDPEIGASPFDDPEALADEAVIVESAGTRTMPHPLTGKMTKFPRASTWGGELSDDYTVSEWKLSMVALGLGNRQDLYDMSQARSRHLGPMELREQGWWRDWADDAHKAMDYAESMSGAHKGTAIHAWGEQLDRGLISLDDVPERFREHLANYQRVRTEAGLIVSSDYIETIGLNLSLHNGVCGRLDGLRIGPGGWLIVDDTKTGRNAPMGLDEIAVQLAIYAHFEWHWVGGETPHYGWVPAPTNLTRRDVATVTWVPIDRPAMAEIIPVDIEWGWAAAQVVAWIKAYRNRSRRKFNSLRLPMTALDDPLCVVCGYARHEGGHGQGLCV